MDFIDYYKILELPKTASSDEIKKAYRKLARKYHPDLNPNDKAAEKKFKELNEANEVLSNPENRQKYDKYGSEWKHAEEFEKAGRSQNRQSANQPNSADFGDDFSEFFQSMYGSASGRRSQTRFRGQDLQAELHFNLEDVYTTQKKTITVNGKNIRITVPAGVENGQTIKIAGHGMPGTNGGPNGDLYITFQIKSHPEFRRDGNDLHKNVEVELYTAILGGEIVVDTFDGKVKLKIAPETLADTKVKLKGKGFPIYKKENQFGDLYLTFKIKLPTDITTKEKELFTELSKLRSHAN